jgi:hypothetical protein
MPLSRKPLRSWLPALAGAAVAAVLPILAAPSPPPAPATTAASHGTVDRAEVLLRDLHPDYQIFVHAIRPMDEVVAAGSPVYMALVRAGADDPGRRESAPYAGPGARNDILFDPGVLGATRGEAWTMLLLDHEYFHARHLAGATGLPLPLRTGAGIERHFFEAAAWGYTVSEARAGRYPGLREGEFREALDRYGEHYRALRALTREENPALWSSLAAPLRGDGAVRTTGSPSPAVPSHLSGSGRAPAIP